MPNYYDRFLELVNDEKTSDEQIHDFLSSSLPYELFPETVYLILNHSRTPVNFKEKILTDGRKIYQLLLLGNKKLKTEEFEDIKCIDNKIKPYTTGILTFVVFAAFSLFIGLVLSDRNLPGGKACLFVGLSLMGVSWIISAIRGEIWLKAAKRYLAKRNIVSP
jgi:hypothetical protein